MVHSIPSDRASSNVPEELYNLTQLADVTLAAGKLSTAEANQQAMKCASLEMHHSTSLLLPSPIKPPTYHPQTINTTPTHSVIRNWSFEPASTSPFQPFVSKTISYPNMSTQHAYSNSEDDCSDATTTNFPTTKLYAHKIFDKRKARKLSYQSDDSIDFEARRMSRFLEATQTSVAVRPPDECLGTIVTGVDDEDYEQPEDGMDGDEMDGDFGEVLGGVEEDGMDVHTCPECGKRYSTSSNLARHRQTHRSLMDKKARRCPHCDKVYVSMPAFSMHVRTHNQGCECPHCGKRFSRPWLLQGHIRTHTGEKPFECSICAKAFADKSNLRAHIQTHSNTKPHTCTRCGKSFALKSYLYKHEESSCIRNLNGNKSSDKDSKSNTKSPRSNSSISSASSTVSSANSSPKVVKPRMSRRSSASATSSELQKRFKEKLRDKLRGASCGKEEEEAVMGSDIILDTGSQKSYIQLTNPTRGDVQSRLPETIGDKTHHSMSYSRCSVIRSAAGASSACDEHSSRIENDHYHENNVSFFSNHHHLHDNRHQLQLQEKPVDFSPKNKCASNGNGNNDGGGNGSAANGFEMVLNYTMVA